MSIRPYRRLPVLKVQRCGHSFNATRCRVCPRCKQDVSWGKIVRKVEESNHVPA